MLEDLRCHDYNSKHEANAGDKTNNPDRFRSFTLLIGSIVYLQQFTSIPLATLNILNQIFGGTKSLFSCLMFVTFLFQSPKLEPLREDTLASTYKSVSFHLDYYYYYSPYSNTIIVNNQRLFQLVLGMGYTTGFHEHPYRNTRTHTHDSPPTTYLTSSVSTPVTPLLQILYASSSSSLFQRADKILFIPYISCTQQSLSIEAAFQSSF